MAHELLSPLEDDVFKYIFADQRNIDNLANLLRPILNLPEEEYSRLTLVDPFLRRIFKRDRQGILDVKAHTTSGKVINIEVQVCQSAFIRKRVLYYLSKLLWGQIGRGDSYDKIQQVIGIIICDHIIAEEEGKHDADYPSPLSSAGPEPEGSNRYLNSFSFRSDHNGKCFTDLIKIITLELPKVPAETDRSAI
ncbi:MAG: Rpn family recombination-promoting nuclease/putative transposase [Spirochaetaceae bacterium]|jgi:predicted transposase/invertase (TIGR01784 family)|nr:Rpn family recombination-promoting nuclease/putative transposase [Spirochaetaceae bacterium]